MGLHSDCNRASTAREDLLFRETQHKTSIALCSTLTVCLVLFYMRASGADENERSEQTPSLKYSYSKSRDGITSIFPDSDYLSSIRNEKLVSALHWKPCCQGFFDWNLPELSFKISNSKDSQTYLSELVINITDITINESPVLIAEEYFGGTVIVHNEGWGDVSDPRLDFSLDIFNSPQNVRLAHVTRKLKMQPFSDNARISLREYLPAEVQNKYLGRCGEKIYGKIVAALKYNEPDGRAAIFRFTSSVNFGCPPKPYVPPSEKVYDVFFRAGISPITIRVPISQLVAEHSVDNFIVRVGADRSARFKFSAELRTTDDQVLEAGKFVLDLFIPKSGKVSSQADSQRQGAVHRKSADSPF